MLSNGNLSLACCVILPFLPISIQQKFQELHRSTTRTESKSGRKTIEKLCIFVWRAKMQYGKKNQKKKTKGEKKKKNQESVGEPQRVSGIPARWQFISTIHPPPPQPVLLPLSVGAQQTHYLEIQYSTDFARLRGPFFSADFLCFLLPMGRAGTQV